MRTKSIVSDRIKTGGAFGPRLYRHGPPKEQVWPLISYVLLHLFLGLFASRTLPRMFIRELKTNALARHRSTLPSYCTMFRRRSNGSSVRAERVGRSMRFFVRMGCEERSGAGIRLPESISPKRVSPAGDVRNVCGDEIAVCFNLTQNSLNFLCKRNACGKSLLVNCEFDNIFKIFLATALPPS